MLSIERLLVLVEQYIITVEVCLINIICVHVHDCILNKNISVIISSQSIPINYDMQYNILL